MRRIQLVLIAGGVLAVLATVLWMLRAPPDGEQRAASVLAGARVVPGDGPDAAANAARDARDAAPERLPSVAATGSSETPAPVAPAGPVAPAPEADDDSVPALFRGRVVDDARVPIAGATVVYWPSQATLALYGLGTDSAGAALDVLPRAVTDGGGRFELQVRHRNGTTLTELGSDPMLVAIAGEFATRTTTCRAFRGGERDVGDLALELGARVIGRIVDSQSRPVAGAIVRPWPRDARSLRGIADRKQDWAFDELAGAFGTVVSGSDGSFRTGPLWDGSVQLMVGADGFLEQERGRVVVTVGAPTDLGDIVLQRGATLAGRVHDGQGAAVAGARIVAWEPQGVRIPRPAGSAPEDDILQELDRHSDDKDVRTDSDGSFLLPGRGAANHSLIVDAAGFEPLLVQDLAAGGPALDLTVVRAASLRLTVLDAESRAPLDSAEVSAQRMVSGAETAGAETGSALPVRAEGAGLFVVERLGRLRTQLVVQAPGHALAALALPGAEPATAREQSVELRREARLQGLVTAADGTPIAKASLVAAFQLTEPFRLDDRKTATDAHGRYLVAGLPPGEWALTADALDFAPVERRVTLVQGQPQPDLDFVLPAAASVFGACFTGEGAADAGAMLSFGRPDADGIVRGEAERRTRADERGRYELRDLQPGEWLAWCAYREQDTGVHVTLAPGERRELDLHQPLEARVWGHILLADGTPAHDAWAAGSVDLEVSPGTRTHAIRPADETGLYEFKPAHTGRYTLVGQVAGPEGGMSAVAEFDLHAGEQRSLDLRLGDLAVRGRVLDAADGTPVAGATVSALPMGSDDRAAGRSWLGSGGKGYSFGAPSGADGRFELQHLAAGRYRIAATLAGRNAAELPPLVLAPGAVTEVEIRMTATGSIAGLARTAAGVPVKNFTLVSAEGPGPKGTALVDAGHFAFENLLPGSWRLTLTDAGTVLAEQSVTVISGQHLEVELVVP